MFSREQCFDRALFAPQRKRAAVAFMRRKYFHRERFERARRV